MIPTRLAGGVLAALLFLIAARCPAQRMQFASPLPDGNSTYASPNTPTYPAPSTPTYPNPSTPTYPAPSTPTYPDPSTPTYPAPSTPTYPDPSTPTYPAPSTPYPAPGTPTYPAPSAPYPAPGTPYPAPGSAPAATLGEGIQPPPQWDAYATPGLQPPSLFDQDHYLPGSFSAAVGTMQRLLQEIRLDYCWLPGGGGKGFGANDIEVSGTFAVPFLYNQQTPLLVTPGFGLHTWEGPLSDPAAALPADLPSGAFDAYLDTAWYPQATPWLSGELAVRIGVYSDFNKVSKESIRFTGRGLAVLRFTPSVQVKLGAVYLDRNRVKILPAGGIVWTPNSDVRLDILFPDPKLARRLTTIGNTEWWCYLRGEYGGGCWSVRRAVLGKPSDDTYECVDYNDLRFAVGLDFDRHGGLRGLFEVGAAVDREIVYQSSTPTFKPSETVFLRAGLAY